MKDDPISLKPVLEQALQKAKSFGADQADVFIIKNHNQSALIRHGNLEGIKYSETLHFSLRVFKNKRVASVSSNNLSPYAVEQLAERACSMADIVPISPHDGLADNALSGEKLNELENKIASLELKDTTPLSDINTLLTHAKETEATTLTYRKITKSNGASCSNGLSYSALATSDGFIGEYEKTHHSLGISVIAEENSLMERDYAHTQAVFKEDLRSPQHLGQEAAERAIARLNAQKPKTCRLPVFFDKRISSSLLSHFAAAIHGDAIYKKNSFLKDALNKEIFPSHIHIEDNPILKRGLASRPFDGEGCESTPLTLVENGVLNAWLLDSRTARLLSAISNGRAIRGSNVPSPGVSNLTLKNGHKSQEELFKEIGNGILITELMGNALNMLTGDYSRGASGFMIRNGEIAAPLAGMTIAGNLIDMFATLIPANDLTYNQSINAPTLLVPSMSVAGQ